MRALGSVTRARGSEVGEDLDLVRGIFSSVWARISASRLVFFAILFIINYMMRVQKLALEKE